MWLAKSSRIPLSKIIFEWVQRATNTDTLLQELCRYYAALVDPPKLHGTLGAERTAGWARMVNGHVVKVLD